jgi:hypothetical protein
MSDRLCIAANWRTTAITQLVDFDFRSFAHMGRNVLAVGSDGLYTLGGDDFDGTDIESYFEFLIDGEMVFCPRSIWFGGEFSGDMTITLTFDGRTSDAKTFTLSPYLNNNYQHGFKLELGRPDWGRYMTVKIANSSGADFSVDTIELVFVLLGRRNLM